MIELIRVEKIDEALNWATVELAPRGAQNQEFLPDMERVMGLLAFPDLAHFADDAPPPADAGPIPPCPPVPPATLELFKDKAFAPIMALMKRGQRMKVAKELNASILESQGQSKQTRISGLVKLMGWGEEAISKAGVSLTEEEQYRGRKWANAILSLEE